MPTSTTIGKYLIDRLAAAGLRHVFGIPGDYSLKFHGMLEESPMQMVGTCSEAGAGFAADAYARIHGLGAVCVTYCVGGLNLVNSVAGAYAEKSPLIVISGAPGVMERRRSPLLHHVVRDYTTQRTVFEKITAMAVALEDPVDAPQQIDDAIAACLRQKRPVYLELPRDMVQQRCERPVRRRVKQPESDPEVLAEALAEAQSMLRAAKRPAVLGGVEIHRFGLQEELVYLVERAGYPIAVTLLGKSIITERHPQYLGVYAGAMGSGRVQRAIEKSDCLLILGAFMSDINLGIYTAQLDPSRVIHATSEGILIKHHRYDSILLGNFINGLAEHPKRNRKRIEPRREPRPFRVQPRRELTVRRLFQRMNEFLDDDSVVICDPGDSLFAAIDLTIHRRTEFISPAYYTSMGFAVPAAVGAQIGNRNTRPVVFVGDGGFQMTGMELSTVVRYNLNPIIFVLNNKGYMTERLIVDGPYNDIHDWAYHRMTDLLGAGWGCEVWREGELEEALEHVRTRTDSFCIVNLQLDPYDKSIALERLGKSLSKIVAKREMG